MGQQTETGGNEEQTARVFGDNGETVEDTAVEETEPAAEATEEAEETEAEGAASAKVAKYRIGDREFDSQADALTYAQSQVEVADAYRQGLIDSGASAHKAAPSVTAQPALDTTELYTDPEGFLRKFETKIKTDLEQKDAAKERSDQIWREFTDRHASLADFRLEVEDFVAKNQSEVRGIIGAKGRSSAYDFIATKIKARAEAIATAGRPARELSNKRTATAAATSGGAKVTPEKASPKLLSFSDQLRNMKKGRR